MMTKYNEPALSARPDKETGDGQHWLRLLLGATPGAASLVMGGVKG